MVSGGDAPEVTSGKWQHAPMDLLPVSLCAAGSSVEVGLLRASNLLSQLQEHQTERLSLPPYLSSEGHSLLPPPSEEEMGVASEVRQELAALTSVVCEEVEQKWEFEIILYKGPRIASLLQTVLGHFQDGSTLPVIQWNFQIKDTLGPAMLSSVGRLSSYWFKMY